jgi:hypothetical protein
MRSSLLIQRNIDYFRKIARKSLSIGFKLKLTRLDHQQYACYFFRSKAGPFRHISCIGEHHSSVSIPVQYL